MIRATSFRILQSGVVFMGIAFILLFFYTALPRLRYPYDLDSDLLRPLEKT